VTTPPAPAQDVLRVVHALNKYLPYSQAWLHRLLTGPPAVAASFVADHLVAPGPAAFPVPDLLVLAEAFPFAYPPAAWLSPGKRLTTALALDHVRERRPHLLHAHFGHTGWRWLPAARRLALPLVTSFYGWDISVLPRRPFWRGRYRQLFAAGARFLCEGPAMAHALESLGCPPEKIGIQRLGIDARGVEVRRRSLLPGEPLSVLAAARFTEKKGLPDAIAAVALASREIDVRLTVAGAATARSDRREARLIAEAAQASGLGERLRFVGVLPHDALLALALRSHVLLQPSRTAANGDSEGGAPVTLVDVGATGLPAVATRHADIPEVVSDGASGLLAAERDVPALAAQLVRLAREPMLLPRLSEGAAARARGEFGVERCAASLRAHYESVVSGA
jgi:colanic acid/amylovoran biosynthesis glycosyltransferase